MPCDPRMAGAIALSRYSHPVDCKKLRYILNVVCDTAVCAGVTLDRLKVLEVGCGVGAITLPLAALGTRITGVDLNDPDLKTLREDAARLRLDVRVECADATQWQSEDPVHVAVASELFEHLPSPRALAESLARQIVPGGRLIVTTPNGYGAWEAVNSLKLLPRRWNWLRRMTGRDPHDARGREHEQRYTRRRLQRMFGECGFRLVDARNSDCLLTVSRRLRASDRWGALDCKLADVVPHWLASGWYLTFIRNAV